jgi:acyl-CoA reductase-like NAD-dependent aldehyde dehydrogenase
MVLEQLQEHAGRQFDHRVVRALMRSDILATYADMMRTHREEAFAEAATSEQPASLIPPSAARVAVGAALAEPSQRYH